MTILIPDTCALAHIEDIYINSLHITDVMYRLFEIQVPTEICNEVKRNKALFTNNYSEIINFVRSSKKKFHCQKDYENTIFNSHSPTGNRLKNRGERLNCSLALYQVRKQIDGHLIVLTDDLRAHRGFNQWFEQRFRVIKTWSSLDLILYVYLSCYPKWTLTQTKTALKTVNARIGGKQEDITKRLLDTRKYLDELDRALLNLPKHRGSVI